MRLFIFSALLMCVFNSGAQSYVQSPYQPASVARQVLSDSLSTKKWSLNKYAAVNAGAMFFKGGSASIFSAPVGLQLTRRLSNNVYAFADVSVAPNYMNFGSSFMSPNLNKTGGAFYQPSVFGMYSRAALGLQYVNDERTFSISGSVGVSRGIYPVYQTNQNPVFRPQP